VKRKLHRLFRQDGRILICAMDHVGFVEKYFSDLVDYGSKVRFAVDGGADAFLAPMGSIVNFSEDFGTAAVIASVPTGDQFLTGAVEHALAIGADAIKCMTYPFTGDDSLDRAARLAVDAARVGLPLIVESIPGGFEGTDKHTPDMIAIGARLASEAGADIVKTFYTGDPATMKQVIDYASVPVVVLGGAAKGIAARPARGSPSGSGGCGMRRRGDRPEHLAGKRLRCRNPRPDCHSPRWSERRRRAP